MAHRRLQGLPFLLLGSISFYLLFGLHMKVYAVDEVSVTHEIQLTAQTDEKAEESEEGEEEEEEEESAHA